MDIFRVHSVYCSGWPGSPALTRSLWGPPEETWEQWSFPKLYSVYTCETRASVIATSMLIWRGNIRAPAIVLLLSQHTGQQASQDCSTFFQQLRPSRNYEYIRQDLHELTCKNFLGLLRELLSAPPPPPAPYSAPGPGRLVSRRYDHLLFPTRPIKSNSLVSNQVALDCLYLQPWRPISFPSLQPHGRPLASISPFSVSQTSPVPSIQILLPPWISLQFSLLQSCCCSVS